MDKDLMSAIKLIEQGFHEEGLQAIEEVAQHADDEQKRTISELYFELGLVDKAVELIEDLMFQYPDHGELFVFAAECYSELGKEDVAIDMLTEINKKDPAYVQAQLLLADIYQNEGLEEVAEQKLLQALKEHPEEPVLQFGLGEFYLSRGDYQASIPFFKKVIHQENATNMEELNPELRLAEAYSVTGQFEDAMQYYEEGLKKSEDINGLFGCGYTALQLEDYETAVKQLTRLKEIDPDYTTLFPYLARSLRALRRHSEAVDVLREGISKDEYNEELYLEMAKLQLSIGNSEEGKVYLEKVIAINPSNVSAIKELLLYFHQNESYEEVLELMSFLEEFGEYDPLFERFKGKALYEENDLVGAKVAYEQALTGMPDNEEILEEIGQVYLELGEKNKGITCFEKLLSLQPNREDIEERLFSLKEELL